MRSKGHSVKQFQSGFTLVELLTVIALIVIIAAVAVPNFAAMVREQRWTSAINSIQTAIMRARTYAVNEELDHAVEFCTASDGSTYLRIEAESAYLEHIPNLKQFINLVNTFLAVPDGWTQAFLARRDAWGADGQRLYTGMMDIRWDSGGGDYPAGWGHFRYNVWAHSYNYPEEYYDLGNDNRARFYYDQRYTTLHPSGQGKSAMTQPWVCPAPSESRALSSDEPSNVPGDGDGSYDPGDGYLDVNDSDPFSSHAEWILNIRDNLAVDDMLYLPHDIRINLNHAQSNLINFDVAKSSSGDAVVNHGWDATPDLRFGKSGHLLQAQTPVIVITRQGKGGSPNQHMRLRLLRGTGRLRKVN